MFNLPQHNVSFAGLKRTGSLSAVVRTATIRDAGYTQRTVRFIHLSELHRRGNSVTVRQRDAIHLAGHNRIIGDRWFLRRLTAHHNKQVITIRAFYAVLP